MLGTRFYLLALLLAIGMAALSSARFLERLDEHSYAQEAFIPPDYIEIGSTKVDLSDKFILLSWPYGRSFPGHYDLRIRARLSDSRLRYGVGLKNALKGQKQNCSGEAKYSFLMTCDGISAEAGSILDEGIDSGYWHVFGNEETIDGKPWYSAAIVFPDRNILWFDGDQSDCPVLAGVVADALDIQLDWFCRSL